MTQRINSMPTEIKAPEIDKYQHEVRVGRWLKNEGDTVATGDVLLELETAKAIVEVDAPCSGTLEKILALEGADVAVGTVVAVIDGEAKELPPSPATTSTPKPMSPMRQVIARRLQESKRNAPHFYVTVSVDMTDLKNYRRHLKKNGLAVGLNDFIVKAAVATLVEFPDVNSVVDDDGQVMHSSEINVGMAVSVDNGLVVPVIRNADKLGMNEIHDTARELANKARAGRLAIADISGATFTVSNMGMFQVDEFSAIINPGESAILAIGGIFPTPVVDKNAEMVVRDMMKITLSSDHRIVDGAMAAQFCRSVKRKLEDMQFWRETTGVE